jgi:hypothetical protein
VEAVPPKLSVCEHTLVGTVLMFRTHAPSFYKHFLKYPLYISHLYSNLRVTKEKQDRQYTYNVTMRPIRETIVSVEKQYVSHIRSVCL